MKSVMLFSFDAQGQKNNTRTRFNITADRRKDIHCTDMDKEGASYI